MNSPLTVRKNLSIFPRPSGRPGAECTSLMPSFAHALSIASGRFTVADPMIALTALNGSLLALLELWFSRPEADSDQAAGVMAEMLLHMLGLSPDEARDLARRPLPAAA